MAFMLALCLFGGAAPGAWAQIPPIDPDPANPCPTCAHVATQFNIFDYYTGLIVTAAAEIDLDTDVLAVGFLPAINIALYGSIDPPGPGIDADLNSQFTTLFKEYLEPLTTTLLPMMSQVNADQYIYHLDLQGQADLTSNATVSEKDMFCSLSKALQLRNALDSVVKLISDGTTQLMLRRNSNATGPAGVNTQIQKECEIAPFLPQSSLLNPQTQQQLSKCAQTDTTGASAVPPTLVNGFMRDFFGKTQFSIPDTSPTSVQLTPNGHVHFTPQTPSEWSYVAAWRYCEQFIPDTAVTPVGLSVQTLTTEEINRMMTDRRHNVKSKSAALSECMHALAYRTACPYNSSAEFAGVNVNSGSCWQVQDLACHRLTNPPPSGLGVVGTGNSDIDYALANCDADGLSEAMFDYVMDWACSSTNFWAVGVASGQADTSKTTEVMEACQALGANYDNYLSKEKTAFALARRLR